jgi:hypothetical protein
MSRRKVELLFSDAHFIRVPPYFLKFLKSSELILLSYLLNWYFLTERPENEGWFFCKADQITDDLYISKRWQTKLMKALIDKGYIEVDMRGMPQLRWIKPNLNKIEDEISELMEEWDIKKKARKKKSKKMKADMRKRLNGEESEDNDW